MATASLSGGDGLAAELHRERRQLDDASSRRAKSARDALLELLRLDARQEADAAEVDAEDGNARAEEASGAPAASSRRRRGRSRRPASPSGSTSSTPASAATASSARERVPEPSPAARARTTAARRTALTRRRRRSAHRPRLRRSGPVRRGSRKNSRFPFGPGRPESVDADDAHRPTRGRARRPPAGRAGARPGRGRRRPSRRRRGPASNCGFTSTSARQPGAAHASAGGSAFSRPMNETSQDEERRRERQLGAVEVRGRSSARGRSPADRREASDGAARSRRRARRPARRRPGAARR